MDENEDAARTPQETTATGKAQDASEPGQSSPGFRSSGGRNDGSAEISLSEDSMQAFASFFPPIGDGLPISRDYVAALLDRLGVTSGLDWEKIDEALLRANLERRLQRELLVATGTPAVDEIPEHAELEPRFRKAGPLVPSAAQRVDFRQLGGVHVVSAGEVIARIVPGTPGHDGTDVCGRSLPHSRAQVQGMQAGKNVERRGDELVSTVEGRLLVHGDIMDVDQVLVVKGAVDYSTGHIAFPGDVFIEGTIHDGFKVSSGGNIVCKSTMDAFEVDAKRDLVCTQGILGRRRAQIRVGGELKAKFVQNCHVAVRGDVHISTALVNCRLYSLGKVDLGDKGVLMGGEVYAVHGLRCGRLGNQAKQRTVVHLGVDFTVQQLLDRANEKLRLLAARSRYVDSLAASRHAAEVARVRADIAKAASEQSALISSLLGRLDADDEAAAEIRFEVFPGVVVEICRVRIAIEEHMKACRFRLDKTAGRIVVER